jgi:DNA modification methylase
MNFLHTNIGSAKDNIKSPIHNWYKFTAGFSHKFVDEIIRLEQLNGASSIFDPFAGCGTTLVSAQKLGVSAVGNEAQSFMYDIIRAKLNWNLDISIANEYIFSIERKVKSRMRKQAIEKNAHNLLTSLYSNSNLRYIYLLKEEVERITRWRYKLFFKLALSQALHKTSIHPIAIPYIVRTKVLSGNENALKQFINISIQMLRDLEDFTCLKKTSKIFRHDSRTINSSIKNHSCDICITSPPYLNNLDYGEVSKVHTHFFGITKDWNDITTRVRRKLVTGSTTHYTDRAFDLENYRGSEFAKRNPSIIDVLLDKAIEIKKISKDRVGKKSFDILMFLYFQDMFFVLKEIKRVIKPGSRAYLILGDSAPYGVYVPTTELLGKIGLNLGFSDYKIHKIRSRGTKWKSLKFRHALELTENVLILE